MQKFTAYMATLIATLPTMVYGASVTAPKNFKGFVAIITDIIGTLIVLIFALTFLAFMWGLIKSWIIGGGDIEKVDEGRKILITGIIALVIMSSIWGILYMLQASLFGR